MNKKNFAHLLLGIALLHPLALMGSMKKEVNCLHLEYMRFAGDFAPGDLQFRLKNLSENWHDKNRVTVPEEVILLLPKNADLVQIAKDLSIGVDYKPVLEQLNNASKQFGEIDLVDVAPPFMARKTGTNNEVGCRANCFNAVSKFMGLTEFEVYYSSGQMKDLLKDHFKKVKKGSKLKFGDVIVFKDSKKMLHAAIYVNENLVWQKPDFRHQSPYHFETMEGVLLDYFNTQDPKAKILFYRLRPETLPENFLEYRHPWGEYIPE